MHQSCSQGAAFQAIRNGRTANISGLEKLLGFKILEIPWNLTPDDDLRNTAHRLEPLGPELVAEGHVLELTLHELREFQRIESLS